VAASGRKKPATASCERTLRQFTRAALFARPHAFSRFDCASGHSRAAGGSPSPAGTGEQNNDKMGGAACSPFSASSFRSPF
jgi:hypothetical protein